MTERRKSLLTQRDWDRLQEMIDAAITKALKERGHRDHIHHGGYDGAVGYVDDGVEGDNGFGTRRIRGFRSR